MKFTNSFIVLIFIFLIVITSCSPRQQPTASHVPRRPLQPSRQDIQQSSPIREAGMQLGISSLNTRFTGVDEKSVLSGGFYSNNIHTTGGIFFRYGLADNFGRQSRFVLQFGFNYARYAGKWGANTPFVFQTSSSVETIIAGEDNFFESLGLETESMVITDEGEIRRFENQFFVFSIKPEAYLLNKPNIPARLYLFAGFNLTVNNPELFKSGDVLINTSEVDNSITPSVLGIGIPVGLGVTYKAGNSLLIGYEMEYGFFGGNNPSGILDKEHNDSYISNLIKISYKLGF